MLSALLGATAVVVSNPPPRLPAVFSDGIEYLSAAGSLREGGGVKVPVAAWHAPGDTSRLAHYPPGFPAAIAAAAILSGRSPRRGAVVVTALATGATLALVVLLLGQSSGGLGAALGVALLATNREWFQWRLAVWSEPLHTAVVLLLLREIVRRPRAHLAHGAVAAAGILVRYVGVAGTVLAAFWALRRGGSPRQRLARASRAVAPSLLVLGVWQGFVAAAGGSIRTLGWRPGVAVQLADLPRAVAAWSAPPSLRSLAPAGAWAVAATSVFALAMLWLVRTDPPPGDDRAPGGGGPGPGAGPGPSRRLWECILVYAVAHTGAVVASRAVLDVLVPFDTRLLLPVLVLGTLAVAAAVGRLGRHAPRGWAWGAAAVLTLWVGISGRALVPWVRGMAEVGQFYTHAMWDDDGNLGRLAGPALPGTVYSNEPHMVVFRSDRPARRLPREGEDLAAFAAAFRARPGPVIVVRPLKADDLAWWRWPLVIPLREVGRSPGTLLYVPADEVDGEAAGVGQGPSPDPREWLETGPPGRP